MTKDLNELRQEIDEIDTEIMQLLDARFECVKQIGKYKQEHNLNVLDQKREAIVVDKIKAKNLSNEQAVISIYQQIMAKAKELQ